MIKDKVLKQWLKLLAKTGLIFNSTFMQKIELIIAKNTASESMRVQVCAQGRGGDISSHQGKNIFRLDFF